MPTAPRPSIILSTPSRAAKLRGWAIAVLLACACLAAYSNSFAVPFTFDDEPSIVDNPAIRDLNSAWRPLGGGSTVSGRPLLNISFALNFRLSGLAVGSYHVVNVLVHILSAFTLFGLAHRLLAAKAVPTKIAADRTWIASAIALLWAMHPVQVESVTYIVQRAESLGSLFLLLTLYGFVRGTDEGSSRWHAAAVMAAWAGALTKETTATTPLLALLYDRCFVSSSFADAWRARGRWYIALTSSWLIIAALVWVDDGRGDTAGFAGPAQWWEYALLQFPALAHYLRVAVWPTKLAFDFGPFQRVDLPSVATSTALVAPLVATTAWALVRRPRLGFVGAAFFVTLAPSSTVVPIWSQIAAEHRMYLPLAAVLGLIVLAAWRLPSDVARVSVFLMAAALATITWQRNDVFRDPIRLWTSAVEACPDNPRAHVNLGEALVQAHSLEMARSRFETAMQLQPNYVTALYDLGTVLLELHDPAAAVRPLRRALERQPAFAEAAYNLGTAYTALRQPGDAAEWFQRSVELQPGRAKAHYNLANAWIELNRIPDAIEQYRRAIALDPQHANAHFNLGNALLQAGRPEEAIAEYETVLRLTPADRDAVVSLAEARRQAAHVR